ncbi:MAG: hypothetical protein QNJ45_23010 [Ardenticatenaceae bacterium]|nr:hypothetical protein [Ardenticatenaceae bacterium]
MSTFVRKTVAAIHFQSTGKPDQEIIKILGHEIEIRHVDCQGDIGAMAAYVKTFDDEVDAIALVGVAGHLHLGTEYIEHEESEHLFSAAQKTPVVDGRGVQESVERWGIYLVDEIEPGIWTRKHMLMVPGLNHGGLTDGLSQFSGDIRYADPVVYFGLPGTLGIGSKESLGAVAERTLGQLKDFSFYDLFPQKITNVYPKGDSLFGWADVLAGDIGLIRKFGPRRLSGKTIVVPYLTEEDVADLEERDASIVVSILPNLNPQEQFHASHSAAELEACLLSLKDSHDEGLLEEQLYLHLLTELQWQPAVRYLKPDEAQLNRIAFVNQPLSDNLFRSVYPWTRLIPRPLLRGVSPYVPPVFLGRLRQVTSPATDFQAEAILLTLGGTPRAFIGRDQQFVLRRLLQAAHLAERLDARLMGVSAYSALMGEAAELVSHKTDIAVTSGRNLSMAAALEASLQAFQAIHGQDKPPTVVVLNANRPDAAACAQYLAPLCGDLTLIANRPEHLTQLKQTIQVERPQAKIHIRNSLNHQLENAQIIVSALSDQDKPLGPTLDLASCYPGTVICDLGRPPLLSKDVVQQRPDLLVIHGAEFRLPGSPQSDIQLGAGSDTVPSALAEALLLALESRFEDFSLDRIPDVVRWREIISLAQTHTFELAGPRQFTTLIGAADYQAIRAAVASLSQDPDLVQAIMKQPLPLNPPPNNGQPSSGTLIVAGLGVVALLAGVAGWFWRSNRKKDRGSD